MGTILSIKGANFSQNSINTPTTSLINLFVGKFFNRYSMDIYGELAKSSLTRSCCVNVYLSDSIVPNGKKVEFVFARQSVFMTKSKDSSSGNKTYWGLGENVKGEWDWNNAGKIIIAITTERYISIHLRWNENDDTIPENATLSDFITSIKFI